MAYDEGLVERIREVLQDTPAIGEKKMFGGVCFTLKGNMVCGVNGNDLMVRVGPEQFSALLKRPHAREMDFTGRPMKGFLFVADNGTAEDDALSFWVTACLKFVSTLPAKKPKTPKQPKTRP